MITHIVMWRVKDLAAGLAKPELLARLKADLEGLVGRVPSLLSLSAGINLKPSDQAADLVLHTTFADWAALEAYIVHPAHQQVAAFLREAVIERRVVDFET